MSDQSNELLYFWNDKYFYDRGDLLDAIVEHVDPENLPTIVIVHPCRKVYAEAPDASCIAEQLADDIGYEMDSNRSQHYLHCFTTAETIATDLLENLYEDLDDPPDTPIVGLEALQSGLDWFMFWNAGLYRLLGGFLWFEPGQHSIGLPVLEWHLERFALAQRANHYIYLPKFSRQIHITAEEIQKYAEIQHWFPLLLE